jgi:DNA-binding transcriptional LysR family regulator
MAIYNLLMNKRLSLHRLDYFVTAAEVGTMSGAAQRLYVSQSAVSFGIGELERDLGVQLMVRSKAKGLALTEAGRQLLPRARALLIHASELETGIREAGRATAGRLVIACFATIAPFLLPQLVEEFQAVYPEITLDFVEGSAVELQEQLLNGRCELAVLYNVGMEPDIECAELYRDHPYVLLSPDHPLAAKETIWLADLASYDMIMIDVPPSMQYFSQVLANAGVAPVIRHRAKSFELTRSLVARGLGYSLLIQHPAVNLSYEGRPLLLRPIADGMDPLPVVLAWHSTAQFTPRATAFIQFCRAVFRQDAAPTTRHAITGCQAS